jgi:hypothetical protein
MELLEKRNYLTNFLLTILPFIAIFFAIRFIFSSNIFFDENNIIGPIKGHLLGHSYPTLMYPTFSYIFFEYFYKVFSFFNPTLDLYVYCRIINALLLGINFLLFYVALEGFLEKSWRLLGAWAFVLSPGVFYSSVVVKTESLQLMEILLALWICNKAIKFPNQIKWPILSGLVSGLAVSTKYNPSLFLIYPLSQIFTVEEKNTKSFFKSKKFWSFLLFFIISVLLTWTTLWKHLAFLFSNQSFADHHFVNYPTSAQAVNEWFAFPYGRYSYAFILIFPFLAGIPNYLGFFLGLIKLPRNFLIIWGGFTIFYLIIILNFTIMRLPHLFTICLPFIVGGSLFFWKNIYFKIKFKTLRILLFLILFIWPLSHYSILANVTRKIIEVEKMELTKIIQKTDRNNIFFLLNNLNTQEVNRVPGDKLVEAIFDRKPKYILALNTYMDSFCHYKNNSEYKKQCLFFQQLRSGGVNYKTTWSKSVNFSYLGLFNLEYEYYLYEKN